MFQASSQPHKQILQLSQVQLEQSPYQPANLCSRLHYIRNIIQPVLIVVLGIAVYVVVVALVANKEVDTTKQQIKLPNQNEEHYKKLFNYQTITLSSKQQSFPLQQIPSLSNSKLNILLTKYGMNLDSLDLEIKLAILLAQASDQEQAGENKIDRKELAQLEYYLADRKYNISAPKDEQPICIFIQGETETAVQSGNMKLFTSLQHINYTNFQVLYNLPPQSQTLPKIPDALYPHMTLVNQQRRMPTTVNILYLPQLHCPNSSIILLLNKGSSLLNRQALKIINAAYGERVSWAQTGVFVGRGSTAAMDQASGGEKQGYDIKLGVIRSWRKDIFGHAIFKMFLKDQRADGEFDLSSFVETDFDTFGAYARFDLIKGYSQAEITDYLELENRQ